VCLPQVLEVRPSIAWDKGRAVDFLLKSLGEDQHQYQFSSCFGLSMMLRTI